MSRRHFVAMVAAGSAALLAGPAGAAPAVRGRRGAKRAAADRMSAADRKEYLRQKASTSEALRVIRQHAMPPGTEMAAVFRPLRKGRRGS